MSKEKNYISKEAKIGKNTKLNAPVRLVGTANVKHSCNIGNYTFINSGTTLFQVQKWVNIVQLVKIVN